MQQQEIHDHCRREHPDKAQRAQGDGLPRSLAVEALLQQAQHKQGGGKGEIGLIDTDGAGERQHRADEPAPAAPVRHPDGHGRQQDGEEVIVYGEGKQHGRGRGGPCRRDGREHGALPRLLQMQRAPEELAGKAKKDEAEQAVEQGQVEVAHGVPDGITQKRQHPAAGTQARSVALRCADDVVIIIDVADQHIEIAGKRRQHKGSGAELGAAVAQGSGKAALHAGQRISHPNILQSLLSGYCPARGPAGRSPARGLAQRRHAAQLSRTASFRESIRRKISGEGQSCNDAVLPLLFRNDSEEHERLLAAVLKHMRAALRAIVALPGLHGLDGVADGERGRAGDDVHDLAVRLVGVPADGSTGHEAVEHDAVPAVGVGLFQQLLLAALKIWNANFFDLRKIDQHDKWDSFGVS